MWHCWGSTTNLHWDELTGIQWFFFSTHSFLFFVTMYDSPFSHLPFLFFSCPPLQFSLLLGNLELSDFLKVILVFSISTFSALHNTHIHIHTYIHTYIFQIMTESIIVKQEVDTAIVETCIWTCLILYFVSWTRGVVYRTTEMHNKLQIHLLMF